MAHNSSENALRSFLASRRKDAVLRLSESSRPGPLDRSYNLCTDHTGVFAVIKRVIFLRQNKWSEHFGFHIYQMSEHRNACC
jgi:hypothetical protein